MRIVRIPVLVAAGLLLTACGTDTLTAPVRPSLDSGGYIGIGAKSDSTVNASGPSDNATTTALVGGYIDAGG